EHSRAVLKQITFCQKELSAKPVHWVAIMSDRDSKADAEADVRDSGLAMPVLIDVGDALYGRLGVALHPVVGIADKDHKLVAYQPFSKINYQEVIRARVRHLLGEISDQELEQALHPGSTTEDGDTKTAHACFKLAERQFQQGNYGKALENVKKSIEKNPGVAMVHGLHGRILAAQGNPTEALKAFEQALKLDPADTGALEGRKKCQEQIK
ncbi:MAG TPA: tetratricopeptide repeat protein, partial [Candidatus Paceibacterota bacterium]|nr:tetratricopeptide repeat protein [Candidatus Paceibacterota bacterium]